MLDNSKAAKIMEKKRLTAMPLCFESVFSDESEDYLFEGTARLRLRRGQMASAWVKITNRGGLPDIPMAVAGCQGFFEYYEAKIGIDEPDKILTYCFIIKTDGGEVYFYNKVGIQLAHSSGHDFQFAPGFKAPDWAKGALMYQIYVDRFYNGDKSNDVVNNEYAYLGTAAKAVDWNDPIQPLDICNFYGGDLQGILVKLPYLKDLGVEVIYLNPVFVSPSNHKYDIQDYDHVDPHLGVIKNDGGNPLYFEGFRNELATKYIKRVTDSENLRLSDELLAKLIKEAHDMGMKVILDGVFNHCGAFNKWLDREGFYERAGEPPGAYKSKHSPYADFFRFSKDKWPGNDSYDSWWNHDNHPKLNFENSPELCRYIFDIAAKWVSPPFNADGWRLDVAADLGYSREFNIWFWREFRKAVKGANPEAIILAEHYGDPSFWLTGAEWDTVMNYDAFMEPLTWFLCGMQKHSDAYKPEMINDTGAFLRAMSFHMASFPREALLTAMNQLSNHDHSRFLTRTNKLAGRLHTHGARAASLNVDKRIMHLAVLVQMTWPGAPCVYYGDEAGLCGWTDPDNRRPYPWGNEDRDLIAFHKAVIALRKKFQAVRTGSLIFLNTEPGILSYARTITSPKADRLITAINNTERDVVLKLPVWKLNADSEDFTLLIETSGGALNEERRQLKSEKGFLHLELGAKSGVLLA